MADPMTQSSQISSSQGLNDGHSATSKESKVSDSFFSSSPASIIQSPQDKRVALGSDKSSESVATSLRLSSQPSSFSRVTYGNESSGPPGGNIDRSFQEKKDLFESSLVSQKQDSSPIKVSPVSERIKALEALAAKQNDSDWGDGGFPHFRDRHYDKSPTDIRGISSRSSVKKRASPPEQESPDSPFEVLDDGRRGSDFEDTADWMRAHLPPAPTFNTEESDFDEMKEASVPQGSPANQDVQGRDADAAEVPESFAAVPDAFMDTPAEVAKPMIEDVKQTKQDSVEDESEFDLRFLPTAYMWDKQEKPDENLQDSSDLSETQDSGLPASPAPPAGFESPSESSPPSAPQPVASAEKKASSQTGDSEPMEILEVDSSGESDDTVIEDGGIGPQTASFDAPESGTSTDKDKLLPEQDKQYIQVPIINVIETLEEQVLSDYEVQHDDDDEDDDYDDDDEKYQIRREFPKEASEPSAEVSEVSNQAPEEPAAPKEDVSSQNNENNLEYSEYSTKHEIIKNDLSSFDQTILDLQSSVTNETQSAVPQSTDETFNESNIQDSKSDNVEETIPQHPPNYEDFSKEIVSSEIDTYLDHYASEELALKDQLNSGVFIENDGDYDNLQKSDSIENSQNNTEFAQPTSEEAVVDEFDEMLDESKLNSDTATEPSSGGFLEEVPVEPVTSQKDMPGPQFEDQGVELEEQKAATAPETFDMVENDYTALPNIHPSVEENTPAPFPSFHNDPSSKITEVISDFVVNDVSDGLVMTNTDQGDLIECNALDRPMSPESTSEPENIEPESTESAEPDSFVEFMRECLKSRQEEEPESLAKHDASVASLPPAMIMDLEQERLTISALKELGSSQEEEAEDEINVSDKKSSVSSKDKASQPQPEPESSASVATPQCLSNEYPDVSLAKEVEAIDIWVAEAYHLAEHVLAAILTHLSVYDLVHWRDPKKSGVVFGTSLLLLLSLAAFSVISVVSYLLLALLCVTISFRIYKSVIQAVQKSNDGHPFKALMEKDVSVPPETFRKHVDLCLTYINRALKQMSRLFLVEDLVDSLKLAVVMWLLTYVGAVFNGITILILADILTFTVPPVYEKNKTQIDRYIDLARTQVNATIAKLQEKLPGAVKRSKTE